ncbi:hypothetical protein C8F04DRAFT_1389210 [Mycena alexandri]|uniref:Uncharacterized protein n=1 Tax=Mycena alexandri TaxID=1745969 RepID=A0AAD6X9N9_9AGAR|nr:hypothetical protein C8F04DRAFT_1389210 [Mycena alexandri]
MAEALAEWMIQLGDSPGPGDCGTDLRAAPWSIVVNYPTELESAGFIIGSSEFEFRKIRESTFSAFMPALQAANRAGNTDDDDYGHSVVAVVAGTTANEKMLELEEQGDIPLVSTNDNKVLFYVRDSLAYARQLGQVARAAEKGSKKVAQEKKASRAAKEVKAASPRPPSRNDEVLRRLPSPPAPPQYYPARPSEPARPPGSYYTDRRYPDDDDDDRRSEPGRYYSDPRPCARAEVVEPVRYYADRPHRDEPGRYYADPRPRHERADYNTSRAEPAHYYSERDNNHRTHASSGYTRIDFTRTSLDVANPNKRPRSDDNEDPARSRKRPHTSEFQQAADSVQQAESVVMRLRFIIRHREPREDERSPIFHASRLQATDHWTRVDLVTHEQDPISFA